MNPPAEPISVSILDREYQFTCPDDERDALKAAALFLDEKMRETRSAGNLMALERVAVMTALNLSDELLKLRAKTRQHEEQIDRRIAMLADELDDALTGRLD